ncbi:hypothetical protein pah_c268o012 [Parachlamydia acanthamoebae str. Hall's coccus]|jgi:hypothetical protein|nr:hypothetical protein pah_c268o012 [Parachlamydia acanthamoebae str. Hall's coccus]
MGKTLSIPAIFNFLLKYRIEKRINACLANHTTFQRSSFMDSCLSGCTVVLFFRILNGKNFQDLLKKGYFALDFNQK